MKSSGRTQLNSRWYIARCSPISEMFRCEKNVYKILRVLTGHTMTSKAFKAHFKEILFKEETLKFLSPSFRNEGTAVMRADGGE